MWDNGILKSIGGLVSFRPASARKVRELFDFKI
jgi:hypothetical protein